MTVPLIMSVSGLRGLVPEPLTIGVVGRYAAAWGSIVRERAGEDAPLLCVGRDSRESGAEIAEAVTAALAGVGCRVLTLGVVATPSVAVMIDRHGASGGVVVTASHNPLPWNGLKCLNADGVAPPPAVVAEIVRRFEASETPPAGVAPADAVRHDDTSHDRHVERVLAAVDAEAIRARGFKIVLDSVNGAGCEGGRRLLHALGCEVVHMNGEPTGRFAHPPEPLAANLTGLAERTAREGAAAGFAQDPDADRLAIVDETGRYIGEECTLALAVRQVVRDLENAVVVANLSTSRMIDDLAAARPGVRVLRTAVGEANVVDAMKQNDAAIGGEGNGGVIFPPVCLVRDSLAAMALVLALLAGERRPLSALVADLPRYEMIKEKLDLAAVGGRDAVGPILERVTAAFAGERLDTVDGVRIDFEDGWVHLRPSNTEPIVRLIAEARTPAAAASLIDRVASAAGLQAAGA